MGSSRGDTDAEKNRRYWDRTSDEYQQLHGPQLDPREAGWGVWQIPERRLRVLGNVTGRDVLELGCGAAQWSIWLALRGARPVGLDNSRRQLTHARRLMRKYGVRFPLVHARGESLPFAPSSFDVIFCDHGAMSFADPELTVPQVARLLRAGGLLAFNMASPLIFLCWSDQSGKAETSLQAEYFGRRRWEGDHVEYNLPYGGWIRLLSRNDLVVDDLIELRPPRSATTSYVDYVSLSWARRWPAENIWVARKRGEDRAAIRGRASKVQRSRGKASARRS